MRKLEITCYINKEAKYDQAKQLIDKILKDYPKAKIRIIFR